MLRCHCWPSHFCGAADWACMQAEEDEQRLSEAQQAAEDEAALRAMREEGLLSDQPTSSHPQPGKPGHAITPSPPTSPLTVLWVAPRGRLSPTSGFISTELPNMGHLSFPFLSFPFLSFPFLSFPCLALPCPDFSRLDGSSRVQTRQTPKQTKLTEEN